MMLNRQRTLWKNNEAGYALLLVMFLATLLLLGTMLATPRILIQGKREKEQEMIWRGKQYARGIKLYYHKMNRFPTSLDDLTKPQVGSLRFMRQAYTDPTNKEDGSWRLIYVGPAGQLIGSLKPQQQNLQMPVAPGMGTPASQLGSLLPALGQPQGTSGIQSTQGMQPVGTSSGITSGTTPSSPAASAQGSVPATGPDSSSGPDTTIPAETPTIIGGNIIGVGGKINERSIKVYEKAKNYRLFEFIWDPSKDAMGVGQPGLQTGTGLGQTPGQNPFGGQPAQGPGGQNPQNPFAPQPAPGPTNPSQPPPNPPLSNPPQ